MEDETMESGRGRSGFRGRGNMRRNRASREGRGRGRGEQRQGIKQTTFSNFIGRAKDRREPDRFKKDKDGDTSMETSNWREKRDFQKVPASSNYVVIRGFDLNKTTENQMIEFINKKVASPVNIVKIDMEGNKIVLQLENPQQADIVQKLSGIRFFSNKLIINFTSRRENLPTDDQLEAWLHSRYSTADKFLNLNNTSGVQGTVTLDFNSYPFVRNLIRVISKACPDVISISFASNNITTLKPYSNLTKSLNSLSNLSFEGNQISDFNEIDHIKDLNLHDIVFANNPIHSNSNPEKYQSEILRRFKTIQYLDRNKVEPLISFGLPVEKYKLPSIKGNLYDSPRNQAITEEFLKIYFECFDKNRDNLLAIYTKDSYFSLTTTISHSFRGAVKDRNSPESIYKRNDRNLNKVKDLDRRSNFLFQGPADIVHFLKTLPQTQHKIDDLRIDAFLLNLSNNQLLEVTLHGSFVESNPNNLATNRSYDRTFLLVPAPQNPQGLKALILNDQFHVRDFHQPMPQPTATETPNLSTPAPQINIPMNQNSILNPPLIQEKPSQDQLVLKLEAQTRLKRPFAVQCLQENNWDYDKSLQAFYAIQNKISSDMLQS